MENEIKSSNNNKDVAKEKIILFVIGVLLGAVISTAAFFVYTKTLGGTPPEKPSENNLQSNN